MALREVIRQRIRAQGPLSFAEYMELALYHPTLGYYTGADQRSGGGGDFFTSVDVGPQFGALLAVQFAEMAEIIRGSGTSRRPLDLVEAAAGNGRLSRDVLDAAQTSHPGLYDDVRLTLVERSARARDEHERVLGPHATRPWTSSGSLPDHLVGIVFANGLLDALPVHIIDMTSDGLREVFVDEAADGQGFVERIGPPGREVLDHVERFGIELEPGIRGEVSPAMVRWIDRTARRLDRGFLVLIDYGHHASELYSATHAQGTVTSYRRHVQQDVDTTGRPPWLDDPGSSDITAHVDLTAVRETARRAGLESLAVIDQSYFLLGAAQQLETVDGLAGLRQRLGLKSLLVPGGLGSTHKVLVFGKRVGHPDLIGCSFASRAT